MSANPMFILLAESETQVQAQVPFPNPAFFKTTYEDQADLWPCRFRHLNFKGLKILSSKKIVKGMPPLSASSKIHNMYGRKATSRDHS